MTMERTDTTDKAANKGRGERALIPNILQACVLLSQEEVKE